MSWNLQINGHRTLTTDTERLAEAKEVRRLAREFIEKLKPHGLSYAMFSGHDGSKDLQQPEEA